MPTTLIVTVDENLLSPENAEARAAFIQFVNDHKDLNFIQRNTPYALDADRQIQFTQNLLRTQASNLENNKFYTISNAPSDVLGDGTFSRTRRINGSVEVSIDNLNYQPENNKAVRIKNPERVQAERPAGTAYQHKQALDEYSKAKKFPHIAMEEPVAVKRDKSNKERRPGKFPVGEFTKSYAAMTAFIGTPITNAAHDFLASVEVPLKMYLELVIIPLLEAYQTQVAATGRAHRDIKPDNILMDIDFGRTPITIVNFIDVDYSTKIGKQDGALGTPGYLSPEALENNPPTVQPSRDIYSLGVLISGLFNPDIMPETYMPAMFGGEKNYNAKTLGFTLSLESYDAKAMLETAYQTHPDFFQNEKGLYLFNHLEENEPLLQHDQIYELLKEMTHKDPTERPAIDQIITRFKGIVVALEAQEDAELRTAVESTITAPAATTTTRQVMVELAHDDVKVAQEKLSKKPNVEQPTTVKSPIKPAHSAMEKSKEDKSEVSITDKEMAKSAFGQASNTASSLRKK